MIGQVGLPTLISTTKVALGSSVDLDLAVSVWYPGAFVFCQCHVDLLFARSTNEQSQRTSCRSVWAHSSIRIRSQAMRFMVMIKASRDTEAGVMPSEEVLSAMGQYNEELANAGVLLGGEGLHPSSKGARVRFNNGQCTVLDGPFAETKELVAGYWLMQTGSLQETIEWVKRCPSSAIGESEIEIRKVFEAEDFGAELTPELREQEERLRAQITH